MDKERQMHMFVWFCFIKPTMLSIFLGKHKRKINSKQLIASWVDVGPNSAVGANSRDCETASYQIYKN